MPDSALGTKNSDIGDMEQTLKSAHSLLGIQTI